MNLLKAGKQHQDKKELLLSSMSDEEKVSFHEKEAKELARIAKEREEFHEQRARSTKYQEHLKETGKSYCVKEYKKFMKGNSL